MSKVYNVIHGVITFLVFGHILGFCLLVFGANIPEAILGYTNETCILYTRIDQVILNLLLGFGLGELGNLLVYVLLIGFVVLYVISQIISSVLRKKRVEKIKSLKRQVKRY
jgi:hypothetical protein